MRVSVKWAGVGLGLAVAFSAGAYPWPIARDSVATLMNSALAPFGGLKWASGEAYLTLLPWPTLQLVGVDIVDGAGKNKISATSAEVALRLQPLAHGRFAPRGAKLLNPTAVIDLDAPGGGAPEPLAPVLMLGLIEIHGGVVKIVSARRHFDTLVEIVDGRLNWADVVHPLSFSLSGVWRGQPVAVAGALEAPLMIVQGQGSGASLEITSPPIDLAFSGRWSPGGRDEFDGDFTARLRSLDELDRWLGVALAPPPVAAQDVVLQAKAEGDLDAFALSEARLVIGGQELDGSLNFARADGKLAASGTLAAESLDLGALLGPFPAPLDAQGQWSDKPFLPAPSDTLDLDLRVSATHTTWGGHAMEDAALGLVQREGSLTAKLLEAVAYQGALTGEISVRRVGDGCETKASLSLDNADIGALLGDWGVTSYSGRGKFEATLQASGGSPAQIVASARGGAKIDLESGIVTGLNFEEALRRSQRRPLDLARDLMTGQTKFDSAQARLDVSNGVARIAEARTQGPGASLEVQGAIDFAAREWNARIVATQASGVGAPSIDAARLTISVLGPWAAPILSAVVGTD